MRVSRIASVLDNAPQKYKVIYKLIVCSIGHVRRRWSWPVLRSVRVARFRSVPRVPFLNLHLWSLSKPPTPSTVSCAMRTPIQKLGSKARLCKLAQNAHANWLNVGRRSLEQDVASTHREQRQKWDVAAWSIPPAIPEPLAGAETVSFQIYLPLALNPFRANAGCIQNGVVNMVLWEALW